MPFRCARGPFAGNEEPTFEALLSEPIIRMVMARDRVDEGTIRGIVREWRERRAGRKAEEPSSRSGGIHLANVLK
jgi:hypothetical protein